MQYKSYSILNSEQVDIYQIEAVNWKCSYINCIQLNEVCPKYKCTRNTELYTHPLCIDVVSSTWSRLKYKIPYQKHKRAAGALLLLHRTASDVNDNFIMTPEKLS